MTMRWPIVLFFNMIDVDGVVVYNLYKFTNPLLLFAKAHLCDKKNLEEFNFHSLDPIVSFALRN
jgi:hypothetical protein